MDRAQATLGNLLDDLKASIVLLLGALKPMSAMVLAYWLSTFSARWTQPMALRLETRLSVGRTVTWIRLARLVVQA